MSLPRVPIFFSLLIVLFACDPRVSFLVLEVKDPNQVATQAAFLQVGNGQGNSVTVDLEDRDFPVEVTLSTSKPTTYSLGIDALDQTMAPVARAYLENTEFQPGGKSVTATLATYCNDDSSCSDDVICNGTEICLNHICESGDAPCQPPHDCVELIACNEDAGVGTSPCEYFPDHDRCNEADVSADGGTSGALVSQRYCSLEEGCLNGKGCLVDENCNDGFLCNGQELCINYQCLQGLAFNPDDGNFCTDDYCKDGEGGGQVFNVHLEDGTDCESSVDGGTIDIGKFICLDGQCQTSNCGDGFVDLDLTDGGLPFEECDDGDANGSAPFCCRSDCKAHRCGDGIVDNLFVSPADGGSALGDSGIVDACASNSGDPSEVCDDGNTQSGDGCRADCLKIEICGDGLLDEGEQCDDGDGDQNPNDGCWHCQQTSWSCGNASVWVPPHPGDVVLANIGGMTAMPNDILAVSDTERHVIWLKGLLHNKLVQLAGVLDEGGYNESETLATKASLNHPTALAKDGLGNLYVADSGNHRIRKIDSQGNLSLVAGGALPSECYAVEDTVPADACFFGENDSAVVAHLFNPTGILVESSGAIVVADTANHRIRKIDVAGRISTFAGRGVIGCTTQDGGVAELTGDACFSGDGAEAANANLFYPTAMAFGPLDGIYFSDLGNRRIRIITTEGIIQTVAGNGDDSGPVDGAVSTLTPIGEVYSLAVDGDGRLYFTSASSHAIWYIDAVHILNDEKIIHQYAGNPNGMFVVNSNAMVSIADANFDTPTHLALTNQEDLLISTQGVVSISDGEMVRFVLGGTPFWSKNATGHRLSRSLQAILDVEIDEDGNLQILDDDLRTLNFGESDNLYESVFLTASMGPLLTLRKRVQEREVKQITYTSDGALIGAYAKGLFRYDAAATSFPLEEIWTAENFIVRDMVVRPEDAGAYTLYYLDGDGALFSFVPGGAPILLSGGFGGDWNSPSSMLLDPATKDLLYIADSAGHRILEYAINEATLSVHAGNGSPGNSGDNGPRLDATFETPVAITKDSAGNLYILDRGNRNVRKIDTTDLMHTVAGPGSIDSPFENAQGTEIAFIEPNHMVMLSDENLYVSDSLPGTGQEQGIRRIETDTFSVQTYVGLVFPGDGTLDPSMEPRSHGSLLSPAALAMIAPDPVRLFIAEKDQGVVKELLLDPPSSEQGLVTRVGHPFVKKTGTEIATRLDPLLSPVIAQPLGLAYNHEDQILYVSDAGRSTILQIELVDLDDPSSWGRTHLTGLAPGFRDGPISPTDAFGARFRNPSGLFYESNTRLLYVADTGNHCIRAIDIDAELVTTVVGTPETIGDFNSCVNPHYSLLNGPRAITVDDQGRIYIADTGNHRVLMSFPLANDLIPTVVPIAGNGLPAFTGEGFPATDYGIQSPSHLMLDPYGNLFVSAQQSVRVLTGKYFTQYDRDAPCPSVNAELQNVISFGLLEADIPFSVSCYADLFSPAEDELWVLNECQGFLMQLERKAEDDCLAAPFP